MSSRIALAMAAAAMLAGCNTMNRNIGSEDPAVGEAVKWNQAIQTINPDPVYADGDAQPGGNGQVGAEAVKRYRTDKVKKVETMRTTTGTTGGSSPQD